MSDFLNSSGGIILAAGMSVAAVAAAVAFPVSRYFMERDKAAIAAGLVEKPNTGSGVHWEKP